MPLAFFSLSKTPNLQSRLLDQIFQSPSPASSLYNKNPEVINFPKSYDLSNQKWPFITDKCSPKQWHSDGKVGNCTFSFTTLAHFTKLMTKRTKGLQNDSWKSLFFPLKDHFFHWLLTPSLNPTLRPLHATYYPSERPVLIKCWYGTSRPQS